MEERGRSFDESLRAVKPQRCSALARRIRVLHGRVRQR